MKFKEYILYKDLYTMSFGFLQNIILMTFRKKDPGFKKNVKGPFLGTFGGKS